MVVQTRATTKKLVARQLIATPEHCLMYYQSMSHLQVIYTPGLLGCKVLALIIVDYSLFVLILTPSTLSKFGTRSLPRLGLAKG